MHKSGDQVVMSFFDDLRTLTYDVIAIQKPWKNSEFFITYYLHKDIFYLIYIDYISIRVCFYINKKFDILSWYANYHNSDLCSIYLDIYNLGRLYIHNICNLILSTSSKSRQAPRLE